MPKAGEAVARRTQRQPIIYQRHDKSSQLVRTQVPKRKRRNGAASCEIHGFVKKWKCKAEALEKEAAAEVNSKRQKFRASSRKERGMMVTTRAQMKC